MSQYVSQNQGGQAMNHGAGGQHQSYASMNMSSGGQMGAGGGYMDQSHGGGGPGGASSVSNSGSQFKRYTLLDLFDEQYGHLQRNDILNGQKMDEKRQIGMGG